MGLAAHTPLLGDLLRTKLEGGELTCDVNQFPQTGIDGSIFFDATTSGQNRGEVAVSENSEKIESARNRRHDNKGFYNPRVVEIAHPR
jgi:hypothetical protein